MLSYLAHYKNKFPGGKVFLREDSLDVYDAGENHVVALRKNGAGQWSDESLAQGCVGVSIAPTPKGERGHDQPGHKTQTGGHDLSPIPKECRAWKHYKQDGREWVAPAEEHAERSAAAEEMHEGGKILSCAEYKKRGWKFRDDHSVESAPAEKAAQA